MKRRRNAGWPTRVGPWHRLDHATRDGAHYDWTGDLGGYDSVELEAGIYKSTEGEQEVGPGDASLYRVVWAVEYDIAVPSGYGTSAGEWTQVYGSKTQALADLPKTFDEVRKRATKHAGKTVDMRRKRNSFDRGGPISESIMGSFSRDNWSWKGDWYQFSVTIMAGMKQDTPWFEDADVEIWVGGPHYEGGHWERASDAEARRFLAANAERILEAAKDDWKEISEAEYEDERQREWG